MASSTSPHQGSVPVDISCITPEATYEAVVADRSLFMSSLKRLHCLLGTQFRIPVVGRSDLDLHKLFIEVTSRGGFDKVLAERGLKEVTATFVFPPTTKRSDYSLRLRKHYLTLLYDYEQIYFPRTSGHIPQGSVDGSDVTGVINGKFENGYFVTVQMGSEQLKGVLYQLHPQNTVAHQTPQQSHGVVPNTWNNSDNPLVVTEGVITSRDYIFPGAAYEAVVADPGLFMSSLKSLHSLLGTKFKVPNVGGNILDLHKLFIEVTSRGGIEKVVDQMRWKDVVAEFVFPYTTTNAAYLLRNHYKNLLHKYEQIYFFRTSCQISQGSVDGSDVTGVIDGKFEDGYLVTVQMGSKQLKGVLYELDPQNTVAHQTPQQSHGVDPNTWNNSNIPLVVTEGVIKSRDSAPKPNRSAFNFFSCDQYAKMKQLHPDEVKEQKKNNSMILELWNYLDEEERSVYQEKAKKDKERYRTELKNYEEKTRQLTGQLKHRLPDLNVDITEADLSIEEAEEGNSSGSLGESEPDTE